VAFWDVDAPATLAALDADRQHPLRALLTEYDYVFTYGGGPPVVSAYLQNGARNCYPIYNALDPSTHRPEAPDPDWQADLGFLGHRLPDREARVHRFFFDAAQRLPQRRFLLGGEGWGGAGIPRNMHWTGHVPTARHNCFNASTRCVLNINRASMARVGFSPPTRIFEAAGAAACVITDAWAGIELFFQPNEEILVAADGRQVANWLESIDAGQARRIGLAMHRRALADHTYQRRAQRVDRILQQGTNSQRQAA
jgi:spore maturation protein CgeB